MATPDRPRVAICAFDGDTGLAACLDALRGRGVRAGDLLVIEGSEGEVLAAVSVFGFPRPGDWLPPGALHAMARDLRERHPLLFIRGNPTRIEALMVDILLNTPALRVEVHDLPVPGPGGSGGL